MSIWGKIVGGAAGFALGGPLGAVVGAVAGHAVDSYRQAQREGAQNDGLLREGETREGRAEDADDPTKSIAFTIGVIVLGAKMAKADGRVTEAEIAAFREVFHVPPHEQQNVARVFNQARRDHRGFEPYAKQLARMFADNPAVLEELLSCLAHVAKADRSLHADEKSFLRAVSDIFGLDAAAFERATSLTLGLDEADPYAALGVARNAPEEEIKRVYRRLVRENHPDRLMSEGMPEEFIDLANKKLAAINAAYARVRRERGFR